MQARDRFLNAFTDSPPDRPPVWIMRQAGRYLPEYRALKAQYDFLTMVKTPELAAEVTLQPVQRFPQLDAAIIFSDILIVPEAMGQAYTFRESGGIAMAFRVESTRDVERLSPDAVDAQTAYLPAAIRRVRERLGGGKALLGFGGAPWTLATYMLEGGSSKDFSASRACLLEQPDLFHALMEKLTAAVIRLFLAQIEAGVDAIQLFDSWAAAAPHGQYELASLQWIRRIIAALPEGFPLILFAKGMGNQLPLLLSSGAKALAADDSVDLAAWRRSLPAACTLQGNLPPQLMTTEPAVAAAATRQLLRQMYPWQRYIFNLGHGITPDARIDTVQAVLEAVATSSSR